jgi:hypothetical protein
MPKADRSRARLKLCLLVAASAALLLGPGSGATEARSHTITPKPGLYRGHANNDKVVTFRVHGHTVSQIEVNGGSVVPGTLTIDSNGEFSYITPKRNFEFYGSVREHEMVMGYYTPVSFDRLCWYAVGWHAH